MHINAQAFEFGLGISPVHIEGNQVFTYEDNNGHTIHYLEPIQPYPCYYSMLIVVCILIY